MNNYQLHVLSVPTICRFILDTLDDRFLLLNITPSCDGKHKDIAEDMLTTKIGSAGVSRGIRKRLSDYIYAQPFASMKYHAIPSLTIRQDENALQQEWDPYWKVGEWYALDYIEHWYQIGNATLVVHPNIAFLRGVYRRTVEQGGILRHDLMTWRNMGLVSNADIVYNYWCGLVDNTGMPL